MAPATGSTADAAHGTAPGTATAKLSGPPPHAHQLAGAPAAPQAPPATPVMADDRRDPLGSAQDLISRYVPALKSGSGEEPAPSVFKRKLSIRRTPSWQSDHDSASPSPCESALLDLSYRDTSADFDHSERAQGAAKRIQSSWRLYRTFASRSFCEFGGEAMRLVQRFISNQGDVFQERAASRAHLVLHFDINKTILMSDAAKGANQADMINHMLSECAWGRMSEGPVWIAVGRLATDRPVNDPQLMTYRNFLDSFLYPYLEGTSEEILAENMRRKRLCGSLQRDFTAPGQPGEMFSGVFSALAARLKQPEAERTPFFAAGQRRILPSFFELLLHLHNTGRSFTVVFRTFGTDVRDVIEEMNMFATGEHPSYPGVRLDGVGGTDLRMSMPQSTAAFVRWGHGPAQTVLALGVDERVLEAARMSRPLVTEVAADCGGLLLEGFGDINAAFRAFAEPAHPPAGPQAAAGPASSGADWIRSHRRARNCAFAIRDYYHFWKSRNERPRAGKLLVCDTEDARIVQLFFDDNIGHATAHIADARDVRTGESIAFSRAKDTYLVRSEPVNAVLDPKFFVRAVNESELRILRNLENRDRGDIAKRVDAPSDSPFAGPALTNLCRVRMSGVARVSLRAKQRWEWALRRILIMCRISRALHDTTLT